MDAERIAEIKTDMEQARPTAPWKLMAALDDMVDALEQAQERERVLREALNEIVDDPKGAYSSDREQYLANVIEWFTDTARAALQEPQHD